MMFEEEKQLIKIISKVKFIIENNFGLLFLIKIFDLAIIINAAMRILRIISVEDIVSMAEKGEIEWLIWFNWISFTSEVKVMINRDDIKIHQ